MEQSFEGARLNTGIVSDLQTLARHLLANFRTIRLPAEALPVRPNLEPTDWWAVAKARRAEKRVLYDLRDGIRRVLNQHRHPNSSIVRNPILMAGGGFISSPLMRMRWRSLMVLTAGDANPAIRWISIPRNSSSNGFGELEWFEP